MDDQFNDTITDCSNDIAAKVLEALKKSGIDLETLTNDEDGDWHALITEISFNNMAAYLDTEPKLSTTRLDIAQGTLDKDIEDFAALHNCAVKQVDEAIEHTSWEFTGEPDDIAKLESEHYAAA